VLVVLGSAGCNKSTKVRAGKRCGPFKCIKPLPELANPVHSVETFARLLQIHDITYRVTCQYPDQQFNKFYSSLLYSTIYRKKH